MPLFSVIIPTFNRAQLCRAAVESVLNQQFRDFELIVVDDGSTDGTSDMLAGYGDRLRLIRQENKGQSIARNSAISAASGEYVAFLDSDDQWFYWTLAILARAIGEGKKPAMVAGRSVPFWGQLPALDSIEQSFACRQYENAIDFFARSEPIILETGVLAVRTDALRAVGSFSPNRNNSEDVDLCLRLGASGGFVRLESPPLFAKLSHGANTGLQVRKSATGLIDIYQRERAGAYPGGSSGRRGRRTMITAASRNAVYLAAQQRQFGLAWSLYRRFVLWNLQVGRVRFAIGAPAMAAVALVRRR